MDESFIYERLKALSGGIEQSQYRDISKAFEEVVKYNRHSLDQLRQQLSKELRDVSERFYLYGAVASTGDAPMVNDFLFPMSNDKEAGSIATIFCKCSLSRMEEIFAAPCQLAVETEEGERAEITARIMPCKRYIKKIEELKAVFYENGIYWRTPYLPYVGKFGDVFCLDGGEGLQGKKLRSVRLKDSGIFISTDMVPLWNVEPIRLKCTVFPIPAIDEQNYRHTIRMPFSQDGYVVRMDQAIKNIYVSEDGLELITEEKVQRDFHVLRIAVKRDINVPHYPVTTNYRRMRHIDRQADHARIPVRTRAEISRMITGYEASCGLELTEIVEGGTGRIRGYGGQYAFVPAGREALLLKFSVKEVDFMTEDQISFLLREVQEHFPQLSITGEYELPAGMVGAQGGAGR